MISARRRGLDPFAAGSGVAKRGENADTPCMRVVGLSSVSVALLLMVCTTGCPGGGEFVPEERDGGPIVEGITADDIGVPCTYTAGSNTNPTNQCKGGLECVMATQDLGTGFVVNPLGLDQLLYEDQFTLFLDNQGSAEGFCSLVGNAAAPPQCPTGTILKLFTSSAAAGGFAAVCLKPCQVSAECSGGRVCDNRYFDDPLQGATGFCVRPCEFDFPDCVRTGVGLVNNNGVILTQAFAGDVAGLQICNRGTGTCDENGNVGIGDNGAPCNSSADCIDGASCIHTDASFNQLSTGYCVRRCFVDNNSFPQGSCVGSDDRCQPGMTFNLAFDANIGGFIPTFDPNGTYATAPLLDGSSSTRALNGLCFDQCIEGFPCPTDGTVCGPEVDAAVVGAAWNTVAMCVPPDLQLNP